MGEFSLSHILIMALIMLIFFGPSRLPGVAKGLGEAIRDFKKSLNGEDPPSNRDARIDRQGKSEDLEAKAREKQKQS